MEKKISCWDLILLKKFEDACKLADESFSQTKSYPLLRNKIIALLNLKRYDEALKTSLEIIQATNGRSDSDYINAGIAYWLMEKYEDAIKILKDGLNTPYTDAAGGVEVPALLHFAAIYLNDSSLEKETISILKRRVKEKIAVNFPGSIAGYLLGNIDENEFLNSYHSFKELRERILCKSYFYIALKSLKNGNRQSFYKNLEQCIAYEIYLEKEYFLAIGELEKSYNVQ